MPPLRAAAEAAPGRAATGVWTQVTAAAEAVETGVALPGSGSGAMTTLRAETMRSKVRSRGEREAAGVGDAIDVEVGHWQGGRQEEGDVALLPLLPRR